MLRRRRKKGEGTTEGKGNRKGKGERERKGCTGAAASTSTAATDDEAKGKVYALQQIIVRFLDINLNLKYFELVSI